MDLHVIIVGYNVRGDWIDRCFTSVLHQRSHDNVIVSVTDDASTKDDTLDALSEYQWLVTKRGANRYDQSWHFRHNFHNVKAPATIRETIEAASPNFEDVIFLLDMDDFLPPERSDVFERILEIYRDPEVWMTYGQYRPEPHDTGQALAVPYPRDWIERRSFRTPNSYFNHPLTFRYCLWQGLEDQDFLDANGREFQTCYDKVITIPMLEMCSPYFRYLDDVLYCYNAVNDQSESLLQTDPHMRAATLATDVVWSRPAKASLPHEEYLVRLKEKLT